MKRGIQPFTADNMTVVEEKVNYYQEHQTCIECKHLIHRPRAGARVCELQLEIQPVLEGKLRCCMFIWKGKDG
jgi:hypothetical protein